MLFNNSEEKELLKSREEKKNRWRKTFLKRIHSKMIVREIEQKNTENEENHNM